MSHAPSSDSSPSRSNSDSMPNVLQEARAPAVGREQVDPRQHAHQVVDPERQDQRQQHGRAPAARRAGRRSRRPGSRSRARAPSRSRRSAHGAQEDREERPVVARCCAASRAGSRRSSRAGSRTARAPRACSGCRAPRTAPRTARRGRRPTATRRRAVPARARSSGLPPQPALNFDQAFCQRLAPATLSASSSWLFANWSGRRMAGASVFGISPCLTRRVALDRCSAAACSR